MKVTKQELKVHGVLSLMMLIIAYLSIWGGGVDFAEKVMIGLALLMIAYAIFRFLRPWKETDLDARLWRKVCGD